MNNTNKYAQKLYVASPWKLLCFAMVKKLKLTNAAHSNVILLYQLHRTNEFKLVLV